MLLVDYSANKQAVFCCYLPGHCSSLCTLRGGIWMDSYSFRAQKAIAITMDSNNTMTALRIYVELFHYFLRFCSFQDVFQETGLSVWGCRWRGSHGDKPAENGRRREWCPRSLSPSLARQFPQQASRRRVPGGFFADARCLRPQEPHIPTQRNGRWPI